MILHCDSENYKMVLRQLYGAKKRKMSLYVTWKKNWKLNIRFQKKVTKNSKEQKILETIIDKKTNLQNSC